MNKGLTFAYRVGANLYVNLTNRCSSACTFCIRQNANSVGEADTLWLEHEPTAAEALAAIEAFPPDSYNDLVFCGYGEPTMALDVLLEVAAEVKRRWAKPIRINTNGQGSLIAGRNIVPDLVGLVDTVSISLNSPSPERYLELTRSQFGDQAFPALLDFARECAQVLPHVVLSTVQTTLTPEEEQACARICAEIGATYRIREWVD
ncbi:MAG: TatD family nuclease-associated radical SAM protein [Coriobacteriia bacterium]|nr:TatD family nuclease-associated radical SAM protein [Coriobacteriia bacterium]